MGVECCITVLLFIPGAGFDESVESSQTRHSRAGGSPDLHDLSEYRYGCAYRLEKPHYVPRLRGGNENMWLQVHQQP